MKLFIFGAGASFGSQPIGQIQPGEKSPLVNELFDGSYANYGEAVGLSANDMQKFRNITNEVGSVEKWLTDRWNGLNQIKTAYKKQSELKLFGGVTFYIWWLFHNVSRSYEKGGNWYNTFLSTLVEKDEDFGIISFNYDTLLDRAFEDVIIGSFTRLDDYIANRFIKPHGSVNWFLPRRDNDPTFPVPEGHPDLLGRYRLASAEMFRRSSHIAELQVWPCRHPDLNRLDFIRSQNFHLQYFYPLVLLPLTSKLIQSVIEFDKIIIEQGKNLMKMASDIYLIGYRAEDEIIKDMLKEAPKKTFIHVIGSDSAQSIMNKIVALFPDFQMGQVFRAGFANWVVEFLKRP